MRSRSPSEHDLEKGGHGVTQADKPEENGDGRMGAERPRKPLRYSECRSLGLQTDPGKRSLDPMGDIRSSHDLETRSVGVKTLGGKVKMEGDGGRLGHPAVTLTNNPVLHPVDVRMTWHIMKPKTPHTDSMTGYMITVAQLDKTCDVSL